MPISNTKSYLKFYKLRTYCVLPVNSSNIYIVDLWNA